MKKIIDCFDGKYEFLSNFFLQTNGLTVEHMYQAAKAVYPCDVEKIMTAETPGKAKRFGQKIRIRKDWEQIKEKVMYGLLLAKFAGDPKLLEKLLRTKSAILIEGNAWHDNYWGHCYCPNCAEKEHKNRLGKLLMKIRKEL